MDYWDGLNDSPRVTVSHIKTRGSGGRDWNNVVPMCFRCHAQFETLGGQEKREYLDLAASYGEKFLEETEEELGSYFVQEFMREVQITN